MNSHELPINYRMRLVYMGYERKRNSKGAVFRVEGDLY